MTRDMEDIHIIHPLTLFSWEANKFTEVANMPLTFLNSCTSKTISRQMTSADDYGPEGVEKSHLYLGRKMMGGHHLRYELNYVNTGTVFKYFSDPRS